MRKLVLSDDCKLVSGEAGKRPLGRAKTAPLSECSRAVALEIWSGVEATPKARDEGVSRKLVTVTIDTDGTAAAQRAAPGTTLQVEVLGNFYDAQVLAGPIYDANGANMHA